MYIFLWDKLKVLVTCLCPSVATPWTVACRAPLPMEFSRKEYWSGLPCHPPGDLHDQGIEARSPTQQTNSLCYAIRLKLIKDKDQGLILSLRTVLLISTNHYLLVRPVDDL